METNQFRDIQKKLIKKIRDEVKSGNVKEPFKSSYFSFLNKSPSFLSKHAVGNGHYREYFIRVSRGYYKLLKE